MFSLSGHWEKLFLLCFIAFWTGVVVSVMLHPCIVCVALLLDLLSCVFDSVCELFSETIRIMFGCDCYFVFECYGSV